MQLPRLTFIHGFMGDSSDWDDVRGALPEYESSALKLKPADSWKASLEQLSEALPEHSVIIGYSMGARLALGLALEYPQRCKALVFVSGNPGLESDEARRIRYAHDCGMAERLETEPRQPFLVDWYSAAVFSAMAENVRAKEIRRKLAHSGDEWPEILRTNSVACQPNYWPRLSELSIPILLVAGELDPKYVDLVTRIGSELGTGHNSVGLIPGSAHMVHREQPQRFVETLREFIGGI